MAVSYERNKQHILNYQAKNKVRLLEYHRVLMVGVRAYRKECKRMMGILIDFKENR